MKIKKYIAPNVAEAMKQIRKELGTEAVILNSKEIKQGGFLGLFKKKRIEVIAGLDPDPLPQKKGSKLAENEKAMEGEFIHNKGDISKQEVLQEIQQIKRFMEIQSKNTSNSIFPIEYELLYQDLLQQEVNPELAKKLIEKLVENYKDEKINKDVLITNLKANIKNLLQTVTFNGISKNKKVIQFIGPTGVGKTTTLAKIASNLILNEKKQVAFITTDTYRIAAVEQLKTYAQILHAPLEVAYSVEDYEDAIKKFESYDVILVDTAGRNFREEKYVNDLLKSTNLNLSMETFLVLSLTMKPNDILEIYDQFHQLTIKEIIFTKMDETRQFGSILNICVEKGVGIAYLTNGQDVPNDIIKANADNIANLIVGEMNNG